VSYSIRKTRIKKQTSNVLFVNFPAIYFTSANVKKNYSAHPVIRKTASSMIKQFIIIPIKSVYAGMDVLSRELSLRFGNFFNEDPRHGIPACVGVITSTESGTITDPESHAHLPFVDVVTVPLDMANAIGIFTTSFIHVQNAVNWKRA